MHSNTPIEWAYYTTTKVSIQKDLCVCCAQPGAAIDQDFQSKQLLPIMLKGSKKAKEIVVKKEIIYEEAIDR